MKKKIKSIFKNFLPNFSKRILHRLNYYPSYKPNHGKILWGDFDRTSPLSNNYGFDRGGAIDRYYVEKFLASEASCIRGNVLEIADNNYTLRFGDEQVVKSDVLHIYKEAPGATYVADLGQENDMPSEHFDCIILTQTLQFIYDYRLALKNCHRMLKKGGTLLLTVPGISSIELGQWHKSWLWSFNEASIEKICEEIFPNENYTIKSYGNVFAAVTFLHGVGITEIDTRKLDIKDKAYDVIVTLRLVK